MSVRPCGGGGFLAVQTGIPGKPTDFSWPFESSVHSKHPASAQQQIATSTSTARLKKSVTPCCTSATNRFVTIGQRAQLNHGFMVKVQSYRFPFAFIDTAYFAPLSSGARGTKTTVPYDLRTLRPRSCEYASGFE